MTEKVLVVKLKKDLKQVMIKSVPIQDQHQEEKYLMKNL